MLGGGLPELSFNLIAGGPGAGKTTLARRLREPIYPDTALTGAWEGSQVDRKASVMSTSMGT